MQPVLGVEVIEAGKKLHNNQPVIGVEILAGAIDPIVVEELNAAAEAAATSAALAEAARDAATVNANVYDSAATGNAAVANGQQFIVLVGNDLVRYQRVDAATYTEVARYPSASALNSVGYRAAALVTDFDALAVSGEYRGGSGTVGNPFGTAACVLQHIEGASSRAKQICYRGDTNTNRGGMVRTRGTSGVWQAWVEIPVMDDVTAVDAKISGIVTATGYVNLIDPSAITSGVVLQATGGQTEANVDFYTTDFIPVLAGDQITLDTSATSRRVCYYNAAKLSVFNATQAAGGTTFTVPVDLADVRFLRISPRLTTNPPATFRMVKGSTIPSGSLLPAPRKPLQEAQRNKAGGFVGIEPDGSIPMMLSSPLAGKKIAGLGDSITYGFIPRNYPGYPGRINSWLDYTASKMGAEPLNYGISGSTLAYHATRNPMSRRFSSIPDAADLVIVMGGTNDVRNGIALGAMGDTTDATYYGALDVLANGLLNKYRYAQGTTAGRNKKIVFATPIRLFDPSTADKLDPLLPSFCAAIKAVAAKYAIPVFDAYNFSTLTPELFRTLQGTEAGYTDLYNPYVTDGTHPTIEGQQILADAFMGFLKTLY